jgi:hypothetical protein
MTHHRGYTFIKVKTPYGVGVYVSQYGQMIKVVPCDPNTKISERYTDRLIEEIES